MKLAKYISRVLLCFTIALSHSGIAQESPGIHFEDQLSWQQILTVAKTENKFIFVDCYATWCRPCKLMDSLYEDKNLGTFLNKEFVSVKYQMDSTTKDDAKIKKSYADANFIRKTYQPLALPSYLFFSPQGELVDRGEGLLDLVEFAVMAANATNPEKQFFSQVKKFKEGKLAYDHMPNLINLANEKREKILANEIAERYINDFLIKQPDSVVFTKESLNLLGTNYGILTSTAPAFGLYLDKGRAIDSVMGIDDYSQSFIDYVIAKEEIIPVIDTSTKNGTNPNWVEIINRINAKFGNRFSDPYLYSQKAAWFKKNKDWRNYTRYLILQMQTKDLARLKPDAGNVLMLNNSAWEIFLYSNNKKELDKAIDWVDALLSKSVSPAVLDTKACLLYKLGKHREAIETEKQASALIKQEIKDFAVFDVTIKRMERGEKIWIQAESNN